MEERGSEGDSAAVVHERIVGELQREQRVMLALNVMLPDCAYTIGGMRMQGAAAAALESGSAHGRLVRRGKVEGFIPTDEVEWSLRMGGEADDELNSGDNSSGQAPPPHLVSAFLIRML